MPLPALLFVALLAAPPAAASVSSSEVRPLEVQSYRSDFGVSAQVAARNLATQQRGTGIVPQLEAVQGKRYAGVWFDNEAGEFVVPVLASADQAGLETSLAKAHLGSDSRTKPVPYSWEELEAAHERIDKALLPLIEDDLVQTSLDPRTNSVVISEAEGASETQRAQIHRVAAGERVSVELRQQAVERFDARTAACNKYGSVVRVCDKPLRAGVFIDTPAESGFCTAGFKAVDAYGNRFMLTAGHCYKHVGAEWRSRDSGNYAHYIGAVEGGTFPGNDWAKIRVNGKTAEGDDDWWEKELSSWPSETAYWYTTGGHDDIPISYESASYWGQSMCHSGTASGTSCGTVSAVDQTVNYPTGTVYHLTEATGSELITQAGDSGGPVFTAGFTALGLLSGVSAKSGMLYAEITEAGAAMGVSVGTPIGLVPPVVFTGAATEVTTTSARLSGTVNPENTPTHYHFEFGPMLPYYERATEGGSMGPGGNENIAVSEEIDTLEAGTVYHYRLVASNPRGTTYGEDKVFTSGSLPPSYDRSFGEEGAGQGQLSHPYSMAVDGSNDVWVADTGNDRVQKFNSDGEYLGQFGGYGYANNQLRSPIDVTTDSEGNVWVIDSGNARVKKFNSKGEYLTSIGPVEALGVATDAADNVLITDGGYNHVLKFSSTGGYLDAFGSKGSGNGQFEIPWGIDVDSSGNIWVADYEHNRVQKFNSKGEYLTQFGGKGSGNGQFNYPTGVAIDAQDNVWVGDTFNYRVQKFNSKGEYLTKFGEFGSGNGQLNAPRGVEVDSQGGIWVADSLNNRVQRWFHGGATTKDATAVGQETATLRGTIRPEGHSTHYYFEYGPTKAYGAKIPSSPGTVGWWGVNEVEVAKAPTGLTPGTTYHFRLVIENSTGTTHGKDKTFTTSATPPSFAYAFGEQGTEDGQIYAPFGVTRAGNGDVWVADPFNGRISRFGAEGEYLGKLASGVDVATDAEGDVWVATGAAIREYSPAGSLLSQFAATGVSLAIAPGGAIWVSDFYGSKVRKFSPTGELLLQFGEKGSGAGQLNGPWGLALDPAGNLWVADRDNDRIQKFNSKGEYLTKFGEFGSGNGQFDMPVGLSTDAKGRLWVADFANDRVQQFSSEGGYVATIGGTGSEEEVSSPLDVSVDTEGNVWVPDSGYGRVQKWSYGGPPVATTEAATEVKPRSATLKATIDPEGFKTTYQFEYGTSTAYGSKAPASVKGIGSGGQPVVVSQAIEGLEPETTYHFRVVASSNKGTTEGDDLTFTTPTATPVFSFSFGSPGSGNGQLSAPSEVAIDGEDNVWVVEMGNNRVQKFNSKGEFLLKFGSEGTGNGQFKWPLGIDTDAAGNVWVADGLNNRIQKFNSNGEFLLKFGSAGSGNGQFGLPSGVDIDAAGNVWVADSGNNRIQKFNSNGEFLLKFGSAGSGNGQFSSPRGPAVDATGNVWVVDYANHRVQKFNSKGEFLLKFGSLGSGNGQVKYPTGIAVDSKGKVWVADTDNGRIQKFNSSGEYLTQFGTKGSGTGQFNSPRGLAFDSSGGIWVVDSGNSRVQKWF